MGALLASAAAAVACAGLLAPASASAGSAQADARLDRALRELVAMPGGPPGAGALVQRGGHRGLHTAGRAKLGSPAPFGARQHMRIASVTKAFTGATLLKLVERGRLSLRSTVGSLLPELNPSWHPITLRQLLYHTSGLPNYTATPAFQAFLPSHLQDYISPLQIVGFAATEAVEFPPGARYEYSNTDNFVMALMAEQATGVPFKRSLSRLVLKPLRLGDTSFPKRSALPRPYIRGYSPDGDGPPEDVSELLSPSGVWAAGAIVSSMRDLNRFVRAWGGGSLLREPKLRRAQTAFLPPFTGGEPIGPGQNRGGLTLFRYATPCGVVYGHSGNFPGYTQWIASSPDGTRSTVVSVNSQYNVGAEGPQQVLQAVRHLFRRAACAALAPSVP